MATVFEDPARKLSIAKGPGKYDLLIGGVCERQNFTMQVQCDGCSEQRTVTVRITGISFREDSPDLELWGKLMGGEFPSLMNTYWEYFHGEYSFIGKEVRGWLERFEVWAKRESILAFPDVDVCVGANMVFYSNMLPATLPAGPKNQWETVGRAKRKEREKDGRIVYELLTLYRAPSNMLFAVVNESVSLDLRTSQLTHLFPSSRSPESPV